ncbi:hypothetical protein [Aeromicrobium sp. UC242_57]|uniref:hypothetical protein n=1 Tax=Aeromicrobium sp. UC242_57 TaxID=3374624 RepID=UPI0037B4A407
MATEEPSVVAAASNLARMTREHGGFTTSSTLPSCKPRCRCSTCSILKARDCACSSRPPS